MEKTLKTSWVDPKGGWAHKFSRTGLQEIISAEKMMIDR